MVGIFFVVGGMLLIHKCSLDEAEKYGDFLNYPKSHMEIWDEHYYSKYKVDFDYYPRGRVIYNVVEKTYYIYYDKCIEKIIKKLNLVPENESKKYLHDFHYKCSKCNKNYVV